MTNDPETLLREAQTLKAARIAEGTWNRRAWQAWNALLDAYWEAVYQQTLREGAPHK